MKLFKTTSSGVLTEADILENFGDLHPPLSNEHARVEAARCLYCYDAPCLNACPTQINIPKFIKQIHSNDAAGAAMTILSQNILGGTCARACPTEELCEEVCVVHQTESAPVKIGELQRYAVDDLMAKGGPHPFKRAPETDVVFAVIGGGPAGLAFAHRFAMLGNKAVIFEKRKKAGGLNEYGLAAYKMADEFAQREVSFLLEIGGIEVRHVNTLGDDLSLRELQQTFDGVFVGAGLQIPRKLQTPGADLPGVESALDFIAGLRQAPVKSDVFIGSDVVVIGGGNTAIDAAVQARCIGAERVTLAYRRGANEMGATDWEQQLATANGVNIVNWASPKEIWGAKHVKGVVFERTEINADGDLKSTGEQFAVEADCVLVAIGQEMSMRGLETLKRKNGKIIVDERYRTSEAGVWAGGDCTAVGSDLTVQAVEDGKQAAIGADNYFRQRDGVAGK